VLAAGVGIAPTPPGLQPGVQTDYTIQRMRLAFGISVRVRLGPRQPTSVAVTVSGSKNETVSRDATDMKENRPAIRLVL
jgi:hypothetical protein